MATKKLTGKLKFLMLVFLLTHYGICWGKGELNSGLKNITSFKFLNPAANGIIFENTALGNRIYVTVPYGTSLAALVTTFTCSDYTTVKVGGFIQTSGVSSNDFTSPVVYTLVS